VDLVDERGVLVLPADNPEALRRWFHAQAPEHGKKDWYGRMSHLIAEGLWDRARQVAVGARIWSIIRAYARAGTPEERDALAVLLKRKPAAGLEEC